MLLKFAIQDFIDDREYKNLSKNTIETYQIILKDFQAHCSAQSIINLFEVTQATIKSYLLACQREQGNNATTRNTKLRTLKTFFNYLEQSEVITAVKHPTKKMAYAKEEVKIEVFTDSHIAQMLGYLRRIKQRERTFHAYRNYVMIIFLLGSGCRLGETVNLRWNDVDMVNGVLTVWGKKREMSSIPVTDKLVKELAEYRVFCEKYFGKLGAFVFVTDENKQLSDNSVKCMFKKMKTILDFKDVRLSAHTFRHTFAHRMCMNGCDVFTLQKMLRHTEIEMTSRYISMWGTALKEQNDKYNPLNSLNF